jgi:hypothetical protein
MFKLRAGGLAASVARGMRGASGTVLALALTALALLAPTAAADMDVQASAVTFRSLEITLTGSLPAEQAAAWRSACDADGSGNVSAEEQSVLVSVVDAVVADANATPVTAYSAAWARENASGAAPFSIEGRADLAGFAFAQGVGARIAAAWDGKAGAIERVETTFLGLAGPVGANATLRVLFVVTYAFPVLDGNEPVHRLTIEAPPALHIALRVSGGMEVAALEHLDNATIDGPHAVGSGVTTATAPVFLVKERPVSNEAFWIVFVAVLAPSVLVAAIAVYALPRLKVEDAPLLVEPKYK